MRRIEDSFILGGESLCRRRSNEIPDYGIVETGAKRWLHSLALFVGILCPASDAAAKYPALF
jgi:hypothetical protein